MSRMETMLLLYADCIVSSIEVLLRISSKHFSLMTVKARTTID